MARLWDEGGAVRVSHSNFGRVLLDPKSLATTVRPATGGQAA